MLLKYLSVFLIIAGFFNGDKPMSWKDDTKLSWDDFKGEAKHGSGAAAVTASGITFSYSLKRTNNIIVDYEAFVHAHFYPNNSWYIKDRTDAYILAHEQLHFDVTELHVRKLRKKIAQLKINQSLPSQLNALHEMANKELKEMQNSYDEESENSIDVLNQQKWKVFIDEQLAKYKNYSSD